MEHPLDCEENFTETGSKVHRKCMRLEADYENNVFNIIIEDANIVAVLGFLIDV